MLLAGADCITASGFASNNATAPYTYYAGHVEGVAVAGAEGVEQGGERKAPCLVARVEHRGRARSAATPCTQPCRDRSRTQREQAATHTTHAQRPAWERSRWDVAGTCVRVRVPPSIMLPRVHACYLGQALAGKEGGEGSGGGAHLSALSVALSSGASGCCQLMSAAWYRTPCAGRCVCMERGVTGGFRV